MTQSPRSACRRLCALPVVRNEFVCWRLVVFSCGPFVSILPPRRPTTHALGRRRRRNCYWNSKKMSSSSSLTRCSLLFRPVFLRVNECAFAKLTRLSRYRRLFVCWLGFPLYYLHHHHIIVYFDRVRCMIIKGFISIL